LTGITNVELVDDQLSILLPDTDTEIIQKLTSCIRIVDFLAGNCQETGTKSI